MPEITEEPREMSRQDLLNLLQLTMEHVGMGDSFEGFIRYQQGFGPGTYLVRAFVQYDNLNGQAGAVVIGKLE